MALAGVDGCKAGWVVALVPDRGDGPTSVHVVATFAAVLAMRPVTIAVDMPIGLPSAGRRACDVATRSQLGARRSSVFPSPIRPMLDAATYPEALVIGRRVDGRGLSRQAFNLIPKIRDVDRNMTRRKQAWIGEAHPELCFAHLLGAPCAAAKADAGGSRRTARSDHRVVPRRGRAHRRAAPRRRPRRRARCLRTHRDSETPERRDGDPPRRRRPRRTRPPAGSGALTFSRWRGGVRG